MELLHRTLSKKDRHSTMLVFVGVHLSKPGSGLWAKPIAPRRQRWIIYPGLTPNQGGPACLTDSCETHWRECEDTDLTIPAQTRTVLV
jgi:hypothetical protein